MSGNYIPGPSKEYIRESVFLYFSNCQNILTLPNLYFGLEKKFLDEGKSVTCSEYRVNTFEGMEQLAPDGINLIHSNVKDIDVVQYDGIFLDFMGTWSKAAEETFEKVLPGTKLAVTFLMARENKKLKERMDLKNRELSYLQLFREYDIEIEQTAYYCDTVPMRVFYGYKK